MISWMWLLIIFPIGWFMFFIGVCMANSANAAIIGKIQDRINKEVESL